MKHIVALLSALFLSIGLSFAAVNVNTATQAELQTLDGIGPVKAKAIIDYRTKNGPFKSINDLEKVSGIGESTLKDIRKNITLTGATSAKSAKDDKGAKSGAGADGSAKDKPKSEMKKADAPAAKSKADDSKDKAKSTTKKDEKKAEASK